MSPGSVNRIVTFRQRYLMLPNILVAAYVENQSPTIEKMPKIDTLDALEEREEHEDDYQTNSN